MTRGRRAWRRIGAVFGFVLRGLATLYFAEVWMFTAPRSPDPPAPERLSIPAPRESSDVLG